MTHVSKEGIYWERLFVFAFLGSNPPPPPSYRSWLSSLIVFLLFVQQVEPANASLLDGPNYKEGDMNVGFLYSLDVRGDKVNSGI